MAYNLRSTFETRSELRRAITQLDSRITARPGNALLRVSYASLLYIAGRFAQAKIEARRALRLNGRKSEAHKLLGRLLYLEGKYRDAMVCLRKVIPRLSDPEESLRWLVQCLLRVNDYAEATRIIEEHGLTHPQAQLIRKIAEKPPFQLIANSATSIVPILQLDPLPVIGITINGEKVFAFLDTGGPGFSTNTEFAEKQGLPIRSSQSGDYAFRRNAPVNGLQIDSLSIGEFSLRNVAGFALQGIRPKFGQYVCEACIGTGVLNQFLSTIDYPNRKLILSRRDSPRARQEHFNSLGRVRARIPFWMASDHCLITKGRLDRNQDLTLLVDSGLAAFGQPTPNDPPIQAAFMTWYGPLKEYGIVAPETQITFPYFYKVGLLGIGTLIQRELCGFVKNRDAGRFLLDSIMMDGLISHAFLKNYTWTIDFDRYEFVFT
jgi:hypothetical protein